MRKNFIPHILSVLALILSLNACTKVEKTEYTNVLPAKATEVAVLNVKDIVAKAGLNNADNQEAQQKLIDLLMEGSSPSLAKELETVLNNPAETGIDWNAPVYLFKAPNIPAMTVAIKITDLQKFESLLATLAKENISTTPQKADGYKTVEIENAGILLAYNDGTLLVVHGNSSSHLKKLQPAIAELMKQPADKSIHTNAYFSSMMQQKGDIRLMATPDALPIDVRGVLKWPHGTQLSGRILFENGRIYATLQRADFDGETHESNQPFHPKNSRELQQAMLNMMRGTPFNIELSSEELITLSNLRVLMEYAPDNSEVRTLYQLIMKIELLNLRGDSNRTTFTIVLNEKNQNALEQMVNFAKQFVGL